MLIGQLRDHLAAGWHTADGADLLHALTVEHPLQPFSRAYFSADSALFSYASEWRQLHDSRAGDDADQPLAPVTLEAPIELLALQRFLRNPVEHFFAARLKVWLQEQHSTSEDDEPFALDGLQRHQLSQWLLEQVQQADLQDDWQALLLEQASRLQQRGSLPLAGFGELTLAQLVAPLGAQLERFREQLLLWDQPLENPLLLQAVASAPDATIEVVSWLAGVRRCAPLDGLMRVQLVTGSLLGKKGALRWRKLLGELCQHVLAAASGHRLTTCLIGADASIQLLPLEQERAASIVRDWLLGYLHGLSRPLPVAVETAFAWLTEGKDEKRLGAARLCYEGNDFSRGEVDGSPALQRSYPDFASLQANDEFIGWAESLYQPLAQAIEDEWLMITQASEDQA